MRIKLPITADQLLAVPTNNDDRADMAIGLLALIDDDSLVETVTDYLEACKGTPGTRIRRGVFEAFKVGRRITPMPRDHFDAMWEARLRR